MKKVPQPWFKQMKNWNEPENTDNKLTDMTTWATHILKDRCTVFWTKRDILSLNLLMELEDEINESLFLIDIKEALTLTSVPDSGMKLLISTVFPGAGNWASLSFCMNG